MPDNHLLGGFFTKKAKIGAFIFSKNYFYSIVVTTSRGK